MSLAILSMRSAATQGSAGGGRCPLGQAEGLLVATLLMPILPD